MERWRLYLPAYHKEAKLSVGMSGENGTEGSPVAFLGPAMLAAFQLADIGRVQGAVTPVISGQLGVNKVSEFLPRQTAS